MCDSPELENTASCVQNQEIHSHQTIPVPYHFHHSIPKTIQHFNRSLNSINNL